MFVFHNCQCFRFESWTLSLEFIRINNGSSCTELCIEWAVNCCCNRRFRRVIVICGAHAQWQAWQVAFHGRVSCNLIIQLIINSPRWAWDILLMMPLPHLVEMTSITAAMSVMATKQPMMILVVFMTSMNLGSHCLYQTQGWWMSFSAWPCALWREGGGHAGPPVDWPEWDPHCYLWSVPHPGEGSQSLTRDSWKGEKGVVVAAVTRWLKQWYFPQNYHRHMYMPVSCTVIFRKFNVPSLEHSYPHFICPMSHDCSVWSNPRYGS